MESTRARISELMHEAAELHHKFWRTTDGTDPDWASWYSDWLTGHSELPELVAGPVVRSELTWLLVTFDKDPSPPGARWEDAYAERVLAHFGERG